MRKKLALLLLALTFGTQTIEATTLDNLNTQATATILIDADTGMVLEAYNQHELRYPASLTKLMTALLLLEHIPLDEEIKMSHDAVFSIPRSSSHIAMNAGESVTALDALYAIMLASANDVSNAIAEHIIGYGRDFFETERAFAALMTARAHELGAVNTRFTNAHGLHDPLQVTTAYDISLIMRELIQHSIFREVIATPFTTVPPTPFQPLERPLNNTNRMIQPGEFFHEYVVGGKTGFTNEASHTLAIYARNGAGLISVVMETPRFVIFTKTASLLNQGFNSYGNVELLNTDFRAKVNINGEEVIVRPQGNLIIHLPLDINPENIDKQIVISDEHGPKVKVNYGDFILGQIPLVVDQILFDHEIVASRTDVVPIPAEILETSRAGIGQNPGTNFFESFDFSIIWQALLYSAIATFTIFRVNRIIKSRKARKRRQLRQARQQIPRGSAARRIGARNINYTNYRYK